MTISQYLAWLKNLPRSNANTEVLRSHLRALNKSPEGTFAQLRKSLHDWFIIKPDHSALVPDSLVPAGWTDSAPATPAPANGTPAAAAAAPPANGGQRPPSAQPIERGTMVFRRDWLPWAVLGIFAFLMLVAPSWAFSDRKPFWTHLDDNGNGVSASRDRDNNGGMTGGGMAQSDNRSGSRQARGNQGSSSDDGDYDTFFGGGSRSGQGSGNQSTTSSGGVNGGSRGSASSITIDTGGHEVPNLDSVVVDKGLCRDFNKSDTGIYVQSGENRRCTTTISGFPKDWQMTVDGIGIGFKGTTYANYIKAFDNLDGSVTVEINNGAVLIAPPDRAKARFCTISKTADENNWALWNRAPLGNWSNC